MNKQLLHVSVVALVLLAVLIVSTTYWQTWAVGDLADRQDNAIALVARLTVDRGKVLGALESGFAQRSIPLWCRVRMPNKDEGRNLSCTIGGLCDRGKWRNHESAYGHGYSKRRAQS